MLYWIKIWLKKSKKKKKNPKMSGYVKSFDETMYMSFFIKDKELLEKKWNIG